jgi:hypothetical protein
MIVLILLCEIPFYGSLLELGAGFGTDFFIRVEVAEVSIGNGGTHKYEPGILGGLSVYSAAGYSQGWGGLHLKLMTPLKEIKVAPSTFQQSGGYTAYYAPIVVHLSGTALPWGRNGANHYGVYGGVDFCRPKLYSNIGVEIGYFYSSDPEEGLSAGCFYAGIKAAWGGWAFR